MIIYIYDNDDFIEIAWVSNCVLILEIKLFLYRVLKFNIIFNLILVN